MLFENDADLLLLLRVEIQVAGDALQVFLDEPARIGLCPRYRRALPAGLAVARPARGDGSSVVATKPRFSPKDTASSR